MELQSNYMASIGLAIGASLGMSGLFFTTPTIQLCLFVLSGVGFTTGLTILAIKFIQEQQVILASGFLLFAIGEAISTLGAASDEKTASSVFAGCMLFYFVGFIFIGLTPKFQLWTRISGALSAILFLITASKFYVGMGINTADTLPGIGYGLLTITIVGWISYLLKEQKNLSIHNI